MLLVYNFCITYFTNFWLEIWNTFPNSFWNFTGLLIIIHKVIYGLMLDDRAKNFGPCHFLRIYIFYFSFFFNILRYILPFLLKFILHSLLFSFHPLCTGMVFLFVDPNVLPTYLHFFNIWWLFDFYNCFSNFSVKLLEVLLDYLIFSIKPTTIFILSCSRCL